MAEEERCIRLFLASINSDVTKREYLKNLDRFRAFTKINKYSELLKIKEKKLQAIVEDCTLLEGNNTSKLHSDNLLPNPNLFRDERYHDKFQKD